MSEHAALCLKMCKHSYGAIRDGDVCVNDDETDTDVRISTGKSGIVVVAVRGTESIKDIVHDLMLWKLKLKIPNCDTDLRVHAGFLKCAMSVLDAIRNQLAHNTAIGKVKCIFTGHSLGGAVATVLALLIKPSICPSYDVSVVTFGSPRVGNAAFADYYNKVVTSHTRYSTRRDFISCVPAFFYCHVGTAAVIGGFCDYASSHRLSAYTHALDMERGFSVVTGHEEAALLDMDSFTMMTCQLSPVICKNTNV